MLSKQPSERLLEAIENNNFTELRKVARILQKNNLLNNLSKKGQGFLHYATYYKKPKAVQILLDHEIDVSVKNYHSETALHIAAFTDNIHHIQILKLLLKPETVLLTEDDNESTIFHKAVYGEANDILRFLLNKYPEHIEVKDKLGRTPLFIAVEKKNKNMMTIKLLLEKGANTDVTSSYGSSLRDLARADSVINALFEQDDERDFEKDSGEQDTSNYIRTFKQHSMPSHYFYSTAPNPCDSTEVQTKKSVTWKLSEPNNCKSSSIISEDEVYSPTYT
ncbi:MAG: ankyrin repeat domain-containing protein [Gammaproteobacteria bacterium]|nr:ankyrin repeat domain-containing protein [Gammaproteobacteria bacterium]